MARVETVRDPLVGQRPWVVIDSANRSTPHPLTLLLIIPINSTTNLSSKSTIEQTYLRSCIQNEIQKYIKIFYGGFTKKPVKLTRRDGEREEGSGSGEQQYPNRVSASPSSARPRRDVTSIPVFSPALRLHVEDHVSRWFVPSVRELVLVLGVVRDAGRRGNASTPSRTWWLVNVADTAAAADSMLCCRTVIHGLEERPPPCHRVLHSSACPRRNGAVCDRDCGVLTYDTQRSRGSAAKRHHCRTDHHQHARHRSPTRDSFSLFFFVPLPRRIIYNSEYFLNFVVSREDYFLPLRLYVCVCVCM